MKEHLLLGYFHSFSEDRTTAKCECGWEFSDHHKETVQAQWENHLAETRKPALAVVELRPKLSCEDIVTALRNIADDIEKGEYDFEPDLAVLVVGAESRTQVADGLIEHFRWTSHGLGDTTFFKTHGLLSAALHRYENNSEA